MVSSKRPALRKRLTSVVQKFNGVPILVIGDLILDRSIRGSVDRLSPEAPVPIVDVKEYTIQPGGAGNVASNLWALGAQPSLVSIKGTDPKGDLITAELRNLKINISGLISDPTRPTTTKTRIVAGQQQLARLDLEKRGEFSVAVQNEILSQIKRLVPHQKGIILSDYGKGLVTPLVIRTANRAAQSHRIPVHVDPKIENFLRYQGVDCITPNTKESIEGMRVLPPKDEKSFEQLGWRILKRLKCKSLLMTRGEKGMLLFEKKGGMRSIPTQAKEVFDVTGAGDTVIATFTLARAVGASNYEAALIANIAAGIVVAKLGTALVTRKELLSKIRSF